MNVGKPGLAVSLVGLALLLGVWGAGRPVYPVSAGEEPIGGSDERASGWQVILQEGFEANSWPGIGWSIRDFSNDGYERVWGSDDFRIHTGNRAAWPARGGRDGIDPALGDHDYPNRTITRMSYGPFSLKNAVMAEVRFYLRQDIESGYDYVSVDAMTDGMAYDRLLQWSGTSNGWEEQVLDLGPFVGEPEIWLAWVFYSGRNGTADGPWIDDIVVRKYVQSQTRIRSGTTR